MTDRAYQHAQQLANGETTPRERYEEATRIAGADPIESGLVGKLADNECSHGRLPNDNTKRCGCWREEGAVLKVLDTPTKRPEPLSYETAQLIIELRRKGMMMPDIVIALGHFAGLEVTYDQVRHMNYGKAKVKRGPRPGRAQQGRVSA